MQVFDVPFILTGGGPENATNTAVLYVYNSVYQTGQPGMGAVVSVVLLLMILALTQVIGLLNRPRRSRR
jgi:multiple sugar transport system permease protein